MEMMIVLILLLAVGGAVMLNSRAAINQARFRSDVRGFQSVLRSVNEAVVVGFDPFLTFQKKEGALHLVYQEAMGRFKKKEFDFPTIEQVFFNKTELAGPLFFGDKGSIYPEGQLVLVGKPGTMEIELKTPIIRIVANDNNYPEWIRDVCGKKEKESPKKNKASSS